MEYARGEILPARQADWHGHPGLGPFGITVKKPGKKIFSYSGNISQSIKTPC
jgi:hypothetical protein